MPEKGNIEIMCNSRPDVDSRIEKLRKIELHRHIEGCISIDYFHELIGEYHTDSKYTDRGEIEKLFSYDDFNGFLNAFITVVSHVKSVDSIVRMGEIALKQLMDDNVVYAELLFSPQIFMDNGMDMVEMLSRLRAVFDASPVKTICIIDIVRNFGGDVAEKFVKQLVTIPDDLREWIRAVSIGGDEVNHPPELFERAFDIARAHGFDTYAHAGEWASHRSIETAISKLKINRVGHGIRIVDSEELIQHVINNNITLDISPTSNYLTGALRRDEVHPIKYLIDRGVKVTINTDDPGYFFTDLNREYRKVMNMGVPFEYLAGIARNNIDNTLLTADEREDILSRLEQL